MAAGLPVCGDAPAPTASRGFSSCGGIVPPRRRGRQPLHSNAASDALSVSVVARDGIEPLTRGFSVQPIGRASWWAPERRVPLKVPQGWSGAPELLRNLRQQPSPLAKCPASSQPSGSYIALIVLAALAFRAPLQCRQPPVAEPPLPRWRRPEPPRRGYSGPELVGPARQVHLGSSGDHCYFCSSD